MEEGLAVYKDGDDGYDKMSALDYQKEYNDFFARSETVELQITVSENNSERFQLLVYEGEAVLADFKKYEDLYMASVKAMYYFNDKLRLNEESYADKLNQSIQHAKDSNVNDFGNFSRVEDGRGLGDSMFPRSGFTQAQPDFKKPTDKSWVGQAGDDVPDSISEERIAEEELDADYLHNRQASERLHNELGPLDHSKLKRNYDENTFREVKYTDQTIYWGQLTSGDVRSGYGRLIYENGNIYEGVW